MTDRLKGFIVTLEEDLRDDDAESILQAIRMVRGVLSVSPMVSEHVDYMARARVREEMGKKIMDILYPPRTDAEKHW